MKILSIAVLSIFVTSLSSCNQGPKVITAENTAENFERSSGIFSEGNTNEMQNETVNNKTSFTENLHQVVVDEVLQASRYVYLNVTEKGKQFWIATGKQDVKVGQRFFYRDGLLKTNFESKEHQRRFDTIYLVTNLVAENHGNNTGTLTADFSETNTAQKATSVKKDIPTHTEEIIQDKGSITISELVANSSAYEGKTVQLTGKCVKINPNIMKRNWIHLQDGSKNDYDLVITSSTFVPEGKTVTIKAEVSLNRDFGAGYRYDLILENGIVIE